MLSCQALLMCTAAGTEEINHPYPSELGFILRWVSGCRLAYTTANDLLFPVLYRWPTCIQVCDCRPQPRSNALIESYSPEARHFQIYGVNLTGIDLLGSIPNVNTTIDFFGSTAGLRFIAAVANLSNTAGLNATGQALVAAAPTQLNETYAVRVAVPSVASFPQQHVAGLSLICNCSCLLTLVSSMSHQ